MVMRNEFRRGAENFGEEFFREKREWCEVTLILKLFIVVVRQGILSGGF
jgi:hypothetical protein